MAKTRAPRGRRGSTGSPAAERAAGGETKAQILEAVEREKIKFMRLQFTDILGTIKNVEIPDRQFAEALDGRIMFDGSSIEGFVRIEESDMYLRPDLSTFRVFPWAGPTGEKVARIICDIHTPEGTPFVGCPRTTLKKVIALACGSGRPHARNVVTANTVVANSRNNALLIVIKGLLSKVGLQF